MPKSKRDTDYCRACGCTYSKPCIVNRVGCHWSPTEPNSAKLCSACYGTDADAKEALVRATEQLGLLTHQGIKNALQIASAARLRKRARKTIDLNDKKSRR